MLKLILNTVGEYVDLDEIEITNDTHFTQDLQLTSYDIVSIIGKIENDLGIEVAERDIRNLETVGELSDYIKKLI